MEQLMTAAILIAITGAVFGACGVGFLFVAGRPKKDGER